MADLIGRTFGNYQIIEQIGIGGMATVYKAYQANMDRYVAIKVLPQQLAQDPEFSGRFEQEVRTIAKLENRHILPVYDSGEQDGYAYLVMRYVGTGTLKDLTQEGPLHLPLAVDLLNQIADGLQYAHDRGVIHRDIKTSNVLIGEGNQCYLTDFGIAKLAASSSHFTSSGAIIGTPAYMSPEQCNGLPVDTRSDLYSLGIVLYEMLTGQVPYEAETPIAVVRMQIDEPLPPPSHMNPNVPEAIEKVVFRALAKDPANRHPSVRALADALTEAFESFTQQETSTFHGGPLGGAYEEAAAPTMSETRASAATRPVRQAARRRGWGVWLAAVALISVAIIVVGTLLTRNRDGDESEAETTTEQTATSPASVDATSPAAPTSVASAGGAPTDQPAQWTTFTRTSGSEPGDVQLVAAENGLWMTSQGGLVHWTYDGAYTKYTSASGLAFNAIHEIALDPNGDVWLAGGDESPGVMHLTTEPDGTITHIDYFDASAVGLDSDFIWTFLPDADGTMLVGTYESYIEGWDGDEWYTPDVPVTDALTATVGDRVWDLKRTQDGTLWAAGPRGLARLRPADDVAWQPVAMPEALLALDQEAYDVVDLYEDPLDGVLWVFIVTEPEWNFYTWQLVLPGSGDAADWSWQAAPDWWPEAPIFDIYRAAADNALWVVTSDYVLRVDAATGRQTTFTADEGIPGDLYFSVAEAPDGTIWVATSSALVKYTGQRWVPYTIENEPPTHDLVAMVESDDGTLWFIAAYDDLVSYRDGVWEQAAQLDAELYDLAVQNNTIWVATDQGLVRWQNNRATWFTAEDGLADSVIYALAVDGQNPDVLWIGTGNGLTAFDVVSESFTTWTLDDGLPSPVISALYVDPAGALWVGTGVPDEDESEAGQVALLRFEGDVPMQVGGPGNPFTQDDKWLNAIAQDAEGAIWVGTDEHVYRYKGERWQVYSEEDGAPDWTNIWDIQADGDVIWFATSYSGLYRLDSIGWLRLGAKGSGSVYTQGLYRASDGALWILTTDGITRLVGDPYAE